MSVDFALNLLKNCQDDDPQHYDAVLCLEGRIAELRVPPESVVACECDQCGSLLTAMEVWSCPECPKAIGNNIARLKREAVDAHRKAIEACAKRIDLRQQSVSLDEEAAAFRARIARPICQHGYFDWDCPSCVSGGG